MGGEEYLIFVPVAFFLGLLLKPTTRSTAKSVVSMVKTLKRKGWRLLVRPNGEIAGVVEREEQFFDESVGIPRKRFILFGMDGKETKEERDSANPKTRQVEDIIAIEKDGGIVLTKKGSKLTEILVGSYPTHIKDLKDTIKGIQDELEDREEEYKTVTENYKSLQFKFNDSIKSIERLEGQLVELRRTNESLLDSNEKFRTRTMAAEARVDMLILHLKLFKERHDDMATEVDEILDKAKERHRKEVVVGGVESPIPPPKPKEETAPPPPPQPRKKKEKEEGPKGEEGEE